MKKGLAMYIIIIIMVIVLALVLGISSILVSQLKIIKSMEDSVIAYYAAETGIERALMDRDNISKIIYCQKGSPCSLNNGQQYYIEVDDSGSCSADNACIRSVGIYNNTRRAIEVSF